MEMERVGVPAFEKPLHNVIRPINDLWLWWVLASVVSYLIGRILPTKLFGTSALVSFIELPISTTILTIPVIWVLHRYLLNFNWKQWIVVNIIGMLVAIVGLVIVVVFEFTFLGIVGGVIHVVMHQPISKDSSISPITSLWFYASVTLVFASAFSIAQWRVLRQYTREHGLGLWVSANIISLLIGAPLLLVAKDAISNAYVTTLAGAVVIAMTAFIVGYTLMQILRPYAPAAAPA